MTFNEVPRRLWVRFADIEAWKSGSADLMRVIDEHGGRDKVVIFIEKEKLRKELPPGQGVRADEVLVRKLSERFGEKNIVLA